MLKAITRIIVSAFILFLLVSFLFLVKEPGDKLQIYFCDVGQGDATYIRFPNGDDMLIDGGPNNKVLDCLGKAMPFYDREISVVMLTHPQADHLTGLIPVLERYKVIYFVSSPENNDTMGYQQVKDIINRKGIIIKNLYEGEKIDFQNVSFRSIWPEREWVYAHLDCSKNNSCQQIAKGESGVLGAQTTTNVNEFSQMGILSYGTFDLLLTGDGDSQIQDNILNTGEKIKNDGLLEVMKVPHHGSKTALNKEFLKSFQPELAVISVGKNSYGHPNSETINMLNNLGVKVERTDQEGTIKITTDGKTWQVN